MREAGLRGLEWRIGLAAGAGVAIYIARLAWRGWRGREEYHWVLMSPLGVDPRSREDVDEVVDLANDLQRRKAEAMQPGFSETRARGFAHQLQLIARGAPVAPTAMVLNGISASLALVAIHFTAGPTHAGSGGSWREMPRRASLTACCLLLPVAATAAYLRRRIESRLLRWCGPLSDRRRRRLRTVGAAGHVLAALQAFAAPSAPTLFALALHAIVPALLGRRAFRSLFITCDGSASSNVLALRVHGAPVRLHLQPVPYWTKGAASGAGEGCHGGSGAK